MRKRHAQTKASEVMNSFLELDNGQTESISELQIGIEPTLSVTQT